MNRHLLLFISLLFSIILTCTAFAETEDEAVADQATELWDKTRGLAGDVWQHTLDLFKQSTENHSFGRVWEEITPKLEQTLTLEDRQDELPKHAWFSEDQQSNQADIDALLDQASEILTLSPSRHYRQRIRALETAIRQTQAEIAEYRQRRISAPDEHLWKRTTEEYEQAIQERLLRIKDLQTELAAVKQEFAAELRRLGLDLSEEQLEFMLSTVIGDDIIAMGAAFDNVKQITIQLEQLMLESRDDMASNRRYYGMYTVLLAILERMHQHLITAVNERYLPEIERIIERTRQLTAETRALLKRNNGNRATLEANLEAQDLTRRAAQLYRDYLLDQAEQVAAARARLLQDLAIARNTYETVKVSGELVALMRSSQQLLDSLLKRQPPALRPFENIAMKREFERLTARLRTREAG